MYRIIQKQSPIVKASKENTGLTVNGTNGHRWTKKWELHKNEIEEDMLAILQLQPRKIKELDIRNVHMTDSTTNALLPHLKKMDKLDLNEAKLSAQNRIILHKAVKRLTKPEMLKVNSIKGDDWSTYWELYDDDDAMQILQLPPQSIKVLKLTGFKIQDSNAAAFLSHLNLVDCLVLGYCSNIMDYVNDITRTISNRQNKIKIHISFSTSEHVKVFIPCLDKISKLYIRGTQLSIEARSHLRKEMLKLANPKDFTLVTEYVGFNSFVFNYSDFLDTYMKHTNLRKASHKVIASVS